MRLVRVTVDAFQCIEHAEVDLGPGLNVLYGPNDLGKSSLAAAIRNVLLLPHGSAAHEHLISWHSGDPPHVALTFSTEPQRFWRVTKTFGSGSAGSSLLEFSKDGTSFSTDATGREVDGKVRELLRWGISSPGGRAGARGIPDSFLANVLLAEQADVPTILARGLTGDPDESGRERLNEALQALAQDPLFKRILDEAQDCVAIAFTAAGQRRRHQGSPFKDVTDEIKDLQKRRGELQTRLNETISAEDVLRALHTQLDELSAQVADAEEHQSAVREAHAQATARAAVENELIAAQAALNAIKHELAEVAEAEKAVEALREQVATAETLLAEKSQAASDVAQARDEANRSLQEATSESGAQARQLVLQQLENDRLRAEGRRFELQASVTAAEEAEGRIQEADRARQALEDLSGRLVDAEKVMATCAATERAAKDELVRHGMLETFARLRDAQRRLDAAEAAIAQARVDREAAARRRDEASRFEGEAAKLDLPDGDVVRGLGTLAQELALTEARLGGGLSVALTPLKNVLVRVAVDGAAPAPHRGRNPVSLEAQRSVELRVDDLLQVTITAGEVAARSEVERLRRRWADEGAPILERAGVPTLAALADARQGADALLRQIAERHADAEGLEQRARQHEERAEGIDALRRRVADLEPALAGRDREELAAGIGELGDAWETAIERRRASAEKAVRMASAELEAARVLFGELKSEHAGCETACRQAVAAADQALALFPEGVRKVLEDGRRELDEIDRALVDLAARIAALSHQAEDEQVEARRNLDAAIERLDAANEAVRVSQSDRDEKRDTLARAIGNLEARRAQSQRLDPAASENAVAEIASRLAGMQVPDTPADEADVENATSRVDRARSTVANKQSEIHRAQGALEQVGGAVIREQLEEIDRALQIALEREHQVEVEYEAWKLLAETLREVENSDGAHLGKALSGPLSERFRALTADRYGCLAIGQELETEGVEAGGQLRPFDALSVGTQDQLATLFRLCIAEHLSSTVVLDDHLSQSDADKVRWFRELLRRTGQSIQVVLLTCRPEDYLLPDEFPGADEVVRDRAAGSLRAVNLARVIRRYALAANPGEPAAR